MIDSFIEQTIRMLERSDVRIHQPDFRKVTLEEGGKQTVHIYASDALYGRSSLADNLILQLMIFFGILDAKVDSLYPELENKKFEAKYDQLPQQNDTDVMTKQLFRILKLLRNASIHKKDAISIENDLLVCKSGIKEITITKLGLELIYSVILLLLKPLTENEVYNLGILRKYYDEIHKSVSVFNDNNGTGLHDISDGIRLQIVVRYQIENPKYEIEETGLTISNPYDTGYEWYGADYLIQSGNDRIIIPSEALNSENKISKIDMQLWKVNN